MSKRPEFTPEQIDWICYQIGDWYLEWKNRMVVDGGGHRLGYAKEMLKVQICGDGSEEIDYKSVTIKIYKIDSIDGVTYYRYEIHSYVLNITLYRGVVEHSEKDDCIQAAKDRIDELGFSDE